MARQRRGGFKPPELRGTLGTLIRTTLAQAGVVRDALERGAREGRSRFDDFRADRRRHEALAELGEIVLELVRTGEIDLGELPEARSIIDHLDELDAVEDGDDHEVARPRTRPRFDARGGNDVDDGTVSALAERTPPKRPGRPTNVWRPPIEEAPATLEDPERAERATRATTPAKPAAAAPARKGGISFDAADDDDDLAEYMHPDDVPPKPRGD